MADTSKAAAAVKALNKILGEHDAAYCVRAIECHDDLVDMLQCLKSALLLMEQYETLPVPVILRDYIKRAGYEIAKATR